MDPTALPGSADEHPGDGRLEAEVVIGDHQLHPGQAPGPQTLEERRPERSRLAVAHGHAQHLPVTVGAHPGGYHHGTGDHPAVDPTLDVGGVGEDVGKLDVVEGPVAEGLEIGVELGADAAHLALGDPRAHAQGLDQVIDLAGAHAVHVGLHDHGEQGPVDAPSTLQ